MKLISLTLIVLAMTSLNACTKKEDSTSTTQMPVSDAPGGLQIEDVKVGSGAQATPGKNITVHYTGMLTNGKVFDTSRAENRTPFQFVLGQGSVIQGWDKGLVGMKVGGKRKLTIPASLAYGASAVGSIPANSTLVFEVELLKVE